MQSGTVEIGTDSERFDKSDRRKIFHLNSEGIFLFVYDIRTDAYEKNMPEGPRRETVDNIWGNTNNEQ